MWLIDLWKSKARFPWGKMQRAARMQGSHGHGVAMERASLLLPTEYQ